MKSAFSFVAPILGLATCLTLAALPAQAQAYPDRGLVIRGYGAAVQSLSGLDAKVSPGFGLGLEYRASERFGIELGAFSSQIENGFDFDEPGIELLDIDAEQQVTPILLQLNFHLTPGRRADVYLGPVVGLYAGGDVDIAVRSPFAEDGITRLKLTADEPVAWGAQVGVDLPIGDRGAFFHLGATYLTADVKLTEVDEDGEVNEIEASIDPLLVRIGFGYRF